MKKKYATRWLVTLLFSFVAYKPIFGIEINSKVIATAKSSVVTIKTNILSAAYAKPGKYEGTGCLIDKKNGYILTNQHVIGVAAVGSYDIIFYDGTQTKAKLLYYDPWVDCGFLKVDPHTLPKDAVATKFSLQKPKLNQPIFIVGNNEGQGFSVHAGVVADPYTIEGKMPQQSMRLSLNTRGGSSGSPIFTMQGEAIALNYATDGTFGLGLDAAYIHYALSFLRKGETPIRQHIGALLGTCSLVDAGRYNGFDLAKQKEYAKQFPTASNNAIQVLTTLPGTPAAGTLYPGDIIWSINGKKVGPHLVDLDMEMNKTGLGKSCLLTIWRDGKWHDLAIPTYDLENHKIKRMVQFGGVLFFEMDDYTGKVLGETPKTLTFARAGSHTIFSNVTHLHNDQPACFRLKVLALNGVLISNLDELIKLIPSLILKRYFTIDYTTSIPFTTFGDLEMGHKRYRANVAYASMDDPKLWEFDPRHMEWKSSVIACK